ncbi:MAG: glycosyl hydrolase [Pseudomonadota bacterium]
MAVTSPSKRPRKLLFAVLASTWCGVLCLGLVACTSTPPAAPPHSQFVYSPYKHLAMALDPQAPIAATLVSGTRQVVATTPRPALLPGATALTLAFAAGECGQEHWGNLPGQAVADANLKSLQQAGLPYIISTGGEGNMFSCSSDAGMEQFVARYDSPQLVGFDFDIEAGQTPDMVRILVQRIKTAQTRRPHLRLSFTVATLAASDAGQASINTQGQSVLAAIREARLDNYFINLMVMDYGPAKPANCVVRNGRCDMAESARQAVRNLHFRHGVPLAQIEVTAMLGINDVVENIFTPEDATSLARWVRQQKLGGLHFWSLDRDTPCPGGATAVSPSCSSLNAHPALTFSRAFAEGLR